MNVNLSKYLSDVLRNEVQSYPTQASPEFNTPASDRLIDPKINQFIVDKRFSLRLDEIV
ncbi:hypothetical protein C2740_04800 [Polynucleobacter sp. MG-5-Ahmo-C2]|uniref:hypothetical protein n=1 Tax=Polynucleobacter sp. MG-5-Ahmo-C2 TaxID=2081051 RepID=UPI001BFDDA34|nr:hypothetical protein [Polynucleobacter sp. MG-5-Ahmo-C2]QWD97692.1 hypothetical protein C2740_04800 [Polynucleobacter sp. MG-5-Ahmo-C2]